MSNNSIVLLHLSDIHFRRGISEGVFDLDSDVRNELEISATRVSESLEGANGVVVTGDVAFSGKLEEYSIAIKWLDSVCDRIGCPKENVWTIPGNHDVDRSMIEQSKILQTLHKELRPSNAADVDKQIKYFLEDPEAKDLLYRPIMNYNEFAGPYKCQIDADHPFWEHDLKLNDGSILRMRGLNSTLVSDNLDDDATNKLIVGTFQATATRQYGVEYMVLCHHPPQWLKDHDAIVDILSARARLQLFGHKHRQRINSINQQTLSIVAGATHPERREPNWLPTFNFLEISISGSREERLLNIKVHPQIWSEVDQKFKPDVDANGLAVRAYQFPIDAWEMSSPDPQADLARPIQELDISSAEIRMREEKRLNQGQGMNSARRLTYRFLRLPYHTRIKIAQDLELLHDDDKGLSDSELFGRLFRRASDKNMLADLWDKVEAAHGDNQGDNPYRH